MSHSEPQSRIGETGTDPRPAAVTFLTTEHFTLQGARAATIAESTGRANMFLASVSGGLIALGLVATASSVGTAFYAFGLVLLPTSEGRILPSARRMAELGVADGRAVEVPSAVETNVRQTASQSGTHVAQEVLSR